MKSTAMLAVEVVAIYEDALNNIACWSEGDKVTGSFDEPASAQIARDALSRARELLKALIDETIPD